MRPARPARRVAVLFPLLAALLLPAAARGAPAGVAQAPVRVGVLVDGPYEANEAIRRLTIQEVQSLTTGEFDVEFPESAYLVGDWTLEQARANLERLLDDPEVDVVIAWGLLASHTVCCYGALPKPVIAPVVIDIELQGIPFAGGASGVRNLNYVTIPDNLANELRFFRRMVPFHKVALLYLAALGEAVPELGGRARQAAASLGFELEYVPVGSSAESALAALPADVDAAFLWPLFHLPPAERARLIEGLNERRLPTFSALGGEDLEMGVLASLGSDHFFPRLARRIALNLQRILLGESAEEIPVAFTVRDQLRINMATARRIGLSPPWDLLIEAELLNETPPGVAEMRTLDGSVREAIDRNLDVLAQERGVAAGAQDVRRARATLLPQLSLSATGLLIDEDRAAASLGSQAERTTSAALSGEQLLFSERALANVEIQRRLQAGRELELETLRLEIAEEAALVYLNLLRASSLVHVRRNNLELTRQNLELATIRRSVGAANPAEVYRWESQIATDRKALIEALGSRQVAEIALNRLLHCALDQLFEAQEIDLDDPSLLTGEARFRGYTETPERYQAFTAFMVEEGLAASPELAQLRESIEAQRRALVSARRAFWSPDLKLRASLERILDEGGAGSDDSGLSELAPFLPEPADLTNWSVAVAGSLSLFRGGARIAERVQAEEELAQLELVAQASAERIEQRIRSAMVGTWSSYPGVSLSRQAAEAAAKNLDLVSDAYARGAVSIITLLDAQNASLNAGELAANAVYDFLIDLMEVERATNRFDFLLSPTERSTWFDRLDRWFTARGVEPLDPEMSRPFSYTSGGQR
jgi:outer membrane protein